MGERKVLNKYYPPDFDHTKLKKNHRPKDKQDVVRMMLPMTIRCNTCGNYLYIGTKFNMRKETALNEEYLGIKIYRFYFKCTVCYAEVTFKTDPKNHDYVVEHGGSRNYEPWRDAQMAETMLKEIREDEEEGNTMKALENKTYDSKREMDILDALEELKELNKRKAKVTVDQLLAQTMLENDKREQEDREISKIVFKDRMVKRLIEDNEEQETTESKSLYQTTANNSNQQVKSTDISNGSSTNPFKGIKVQIKAKKVLKEEEPPKNAFASSVKPILSVTTGGASPSLTTQAKAGNKLAGLLNYSDDE